MANYIFKLPDIGEGIAEAEIVEWHVAVGDMIEEDEPLVDMMPDKATVAIESPVSGKVTGLAGEVGDQVAIGAQLVVIEVEGDGDVPQPAPPQQAPETTAGAAETKQHFERSEDSGRPDEPEPSPDDEASLVTEAELVRDKEPEAASTTPDAPPVTVAKVFASPAVRARAKDLGVDLAHVKTTTDRIRHGDLDAYLLNNSAQGYRAPGGAGRREDETVKVMGLRRRIAENMAASKRNIPHSPMSRKWTSLRLRPSVHS